MDLSTQEHGKLSSLVIRCCGEWIHCLMYVLSKVSCRHPVALHLPQEKKVVGVATICLFICANDHVKNERPNYRRSPVFCPQVHFDTFHVQSLDAVLQLCVTLFQ